MTDSLSNLSARDGGSSLREPAILSASDSNLDSHGEASTAAPAHRPVDQEEISRDELTVISQTHDVEIQKANVASLEGRRIGHFELKQFLGGGGMGLVFRAFDSVLARSVAIKLLPKTGANNELVQRFQVEARSAARLDHPNVSRVFQVGSDDACNYIIFEFVEGDNLSQLVRRIGPLPFDLGLRYTFQLALAIQHAYQRGVVHRDIKPANVVVTDGGKLKLIDLGLARSPKANENDNSLTATGVMLGTYDYLSPEQARDSRSADVRSDLYSLGCTVFFMLTGQPPYPQGTPIEKIIQHSSEKRPKPSDNRADLPPGFDELTSKLLAINPDERFQRPAELIAEIQELASKNNIPLLGYDDNVVVKKIITKPSWSMQLVPVLIPIILLIGFVLYLDWTDQSNRSNANSFFGNSQQDQTGGNRTGEKSLSPSGKQDAAGKGASAVMPSGAKSGKQEAGKKIAKSSKATEKRNGNAADADQLDAASANYVVVGPDGDSANEFEGFEEFEEAIEAINNDPRIEEIRINRDSILLTRPVSIKINQKLKITTMGDRQCIFVFRPEEKATSGLVKIRGGDVEFDKVNFRLENSSEMEDGAASSDTVATLIELEGISSVDFANGSLTVDNFDDDGKRILGAARFLSMKPSNKSKEVFSDAGKEPVVSKPSITFRNFCIRGEADVLHMARSFPLTILLNNGLIVTDGLVFDFGPASEKFEVQGGEIEIHATRVTVVSGQGVARVDSGRVNEPMPLRVVCKNSIFNYGNQKGFLTHINSQETLQKNKWFALKSQDSFYPKKNPVWVIDYADVGVASDQMTFSSMEDWLEVKGYEGDTANVSWESFEGLAIPPSEHTVFDYALSGKIEKNPAIRWEAGIDMGFEFQPIPPAFIE